MKPGEAIGTFTQPVIKLITVKDSRYNDSFDPPTTHLNQPIAHISPIGVARLALPYLESLIAEASDYVQTSIGGAAAP
jgi:hypothetical protein